VAQSSLPADLVDAGRKPAPLATGLTRRMADDHPREAGDTSALPGASDHRGLGPVRQRGASGPVTFWPDPDILSVIANPTNPATPGRPGTGNCLATVQPGTFCGRRDKVSMPTRSTTFHELHARYAGDVFRFAHWLTGNAGAAQEITAETFARVWTAPEEPRMESVKAYLFAIARNLHRQRWRRTSRFEALDEAMPDAGVAPDEAAAQQDEFQRTLAALQALPETDRTLLLLRAEEDLSYEDIAVATGLSVTAAKVRVFRARAKLAAILSADKGLPS